MSFMLLISPAKKMNVLDEPPYPSGQPRFLTQTEQLMHAIQALSYSEAKALWRRSDKLAQLNYERFHDMDLTRNLTAAVTAYEGIQYQHLAAQVMSEQELAYLDNHLRILSGFYGVLRPYDGVVPYRLEMQAKLAVGESNDLYRFWGTSLAEVLSHETDTLVNLASVEYAKAVVPHVHTMGMRVLTCLFGQVLNGRFVQRSTEAKAARGTFVCWCTERDIENLDDFANFTDRGYELDPARSSEDKLVFVRS